MVEGWDKAKIVILSLAMACLGLGRKLSTKLVIPTGTELGNKDQLYFFSNPNPTLNGWDLAKGSLKKSIT